MTNPIFNKDGNGNVHYTQYFNDRKNGTLNDKIIISNNKKMYFLLNTNNFLTFVGNTLEFDDADYLSSLGLLFNKDIHTKLDYKGAYHPYFTEQAKNLDDYTKLSKQYADNPDTDTFYDDTMYHGAFVEFLDARDGQFDGTITKATLDEFYAHAEAGTDYTTADFEAARRVINPQTIPSKQPHKSNSSVGKQRNTKAKPRNGLLNILLMGGLAWLAIDWFKKKDAQPVAQPVSPLMGYSAYQSMQLSV